MRPVTQLGELVGRCLAAAPQVVEGGTEVTWSMEGTWKGIMPPVLDGWMKLATPWMIGGMFDRGLQNLKEKVEAAG